MPKSINAPRNNVIADKRNISIAEIFFLLAREIKLIVLFTLVVIAIAFFKLKFFTSPVYSSTAKIISSNNSNTSLLGGMASQFGFQFPSKNNQNNINWVYPEIIKSRTMAKALIGRKYDTKKHGSQISLIDILIPSNKKKPEKKEIVLTQAVEKTLKMISVKEDKRTGITSIIATAFEPMLASQLVHAVIEELDKHQKTFNSKQLKKTKDFIQKRVFEVETELSSAEIKLKNFQERNRRIENSPTLLLEKQRLGREVSVLTGVFTSLKQQLENAKIEEVRESDFVVVLDDPTTPIFPSAPNKKRLFFIASSLGLIVSIILAFFKNFLIKVYSENYKTIFEIIAIFVDNIKRLLFIKSD